MAVWVISVVWHRWEASCSLSLLLAPQPIHKLTPPGAACHISENLIGHQHRQVDSLSRARACWPVHAPLDSGSDAERHHDGQAPGPGARKDNGRRAGLGVLQCNPPSGLTTLQRLDLQQLLPLLS